MSANPSTTGSAFRDWFSYKNLIPVCLLFLFLFGWLGSLLLSRPSEDEVGEAAASGAAEAVMQVVAANQAAESPPTTESPPKPYYDFLTCEGMSAEQTCQPVFAYDLTPEAKALIGFELNTKDWPNMERGRSVFIQWRGMHGVNECDLSIAIEPLPTLGDRPAADRKLYPTKVPGRASLLDCTPKAVDAKGGLPTVGQS